MVEKISNIFCFLLSKSKGNLPTYQLIHIFVLFLFNKHSERGGGPTAFSKALLSSPQMYYKIFVLISLFQDVLNVVSCCTVGPYVKC